MVEVVFYEKPGCAGNARQRRLLEEAGHRVEARDLLSAPWTRDSLRPFFGDRPVAEWFNRAAPAVKSGAVVPEALDEAGALDLLLATPLLIRRPLMRVGEERRCGFDVDAVDAWIGLAEQRPAGSLEGCVRPDMPPCPPPAAGVTPRASG
ncbi:ArsC/Spx/MgsR family protein [Azospirillum halopraeferens]|uniref:ArsC/Spx/MgsR family protein n=1 Tax=Azospirillum halopraeferens TaxID=34010 RepID=UPI00041A8517|nr:ArsC/Spx/MgsR family protein [Azospirillum halopraeferens]